MKKLGKLNINPEKVIKNDELFTLKGGVYGPCTCLCVNHNTYVWEGYLVSQTGDCNEDCTFAFGVPSFGECV